MKKHYTIVDSEKTKVSDKLKRGVDIVANPTKSTLGPQGKTVLITTQYGINSTKDGVTVARAIEPQDPVEATAANLMKQIAVRTVDECGDGTTTSTIIAQELFNAGLKVMPYITDRKKLKDSIELKVKEAVKCIQSMSTPVILDSNGNNDPLKNIATISSNGDIEMAETIVEAFMAVQGKGFITVEETGEEGYKVEKVDGFKVDAGYVHPYFMSDIRSLNYEAIKPIIVLYHKQLTSLGDILPILERANGRPIVIYADNFTPTVTEKAIENKLQGRLNICLCKVQGYGDQITDTFNEIAAITNASIIDQHTPQEEYINMLGAAAKIIVTKYDTKLIGETDRDPSKFNELVSQIETLLTETNNEHDKKKFSERLSRLVGGVAIIKVGGKTAVEIHEKKDRVDDATNAVRAALEEGYTVGGGKALYYAAQMLSNDGSEGYKIVHSALLAPLKTLCENSGTSFEYFDEKLKTSEFNEGINFAKGSEVVNLVADGVIDPVKVLRTALESAVSVVTLLLTTDYVVTVIEEPDTETK